MIIDRLTSRYAVCHVGDGFSVEDLATGDRVGWYRTLAAAEAARIRVSNTLRRALQLEQKED